MDNLTKFTKWKFRKMKENPWKCHKCGSTNLDQEWQFMAPMNEEDHEDEHAEGLVAGACQTDFYWCNECDEETDPIRDED